MSEGLAFSLPGLAFAAARRSVRRRDAGELCRPPGRLARATACRRTRRRHDLVDSRRTPATSPIEGIRRAMMKTLFLQPPSFDGFDGGAGSRYQAKREIKSFWFPTWLAQPAALVPGSKLIDAPPARIGLETVTRQARDYELCVIHTSTPSFASDVKVAAGAEGRQSVAEDRLRRRQGRGAAGGEPRARRADRFRRAQRVRLHHQGNRRGPRLGRDRRHFLPQQRRRDRPQQGSRDPGGHGPASRS